MRNNINEDLKVFNEIAKMFLKDEITHPVSGQTEMKKLQKEIDISLNYNPLDNKKYIQILKEIVLKTPKTSSRLFFNQLFGGRHSKAVLGELLAVLLNNSMATYKIAGPQVAIEKEIINKVANLVGYNEKSSGGTFPTGGSMSNFMSLVMARDKCSLEIKNKGCPKNLILYTSENGHYSVEKNTSLVGVGKNNIRNIKSNKNGEMDVQDLLQNIENDINLGHSPFYVNATAGTTVLGSFDPINEISNVCKKYNLWLHVDGAYCGSVIFSKKYQKLIKGIKKSDSFSFNAHKTLGTPLSCSILVVKEKKNLYNSFNNEATYLYQTNEDEENLGKTSFECGRRNNALKFWALWKSIGQKGISEMIEKEFLLAEISRKYILNNRDYKIYGPRKSLSVCFNYKNFDAKELCKQLYKKNKLMIGYGSFKNTNFIRLVTVNNNNSKKDILEMFNILEKFTEKNKKMLKTV